MSTLPFMLHFHSHHSNPTQMSIYIPYGKEGSGYYSSQIQAVAVAAEEATGLMLKALGEYTVASQVNVRSTLSFQSSQRTEGKCVVVFKWL